MSRNTTGDKVRCWDCGILIPNARCPDHASICLYRKGYEGRPENRTTDPRPPKTYDDAFLDGTATEHAARKMDQNLLHFILNWRTESEQAFAELSDEERGQLRIGFSSEEGSSEVSSDGYVGDEESESSGEWK